MNVTRRQFLSLLAASAAGFAIAEAFPLAKSWFGKYHLKVNHPITYYSAEELKKLRISAHPSPFWNFKKVGRVVEGLKKHGLNVTMGKLNRLPDEPADMYVIGDWYHPRIIADAQQHGKNILVQESGFFQPRLTWSSLGFNGLNGYATFAPAPPSDQGERFRTYFGKYVRPWRTNKKGYALLIGQVPKDKSLHGLNMENWLQETADELNERHIEVVFRPHPVVVKRAQKKHQKLFVPSGTRLSSGTLDEDMAGAAYLVIYSSTTAVESVLAGVPAVVFSPGSVAWDMTSHDLDAPLVTPDRTQWCTDMAWRQWTEEELSNGTAWEHTKQVILKS